MKLEKSKSTPSLILKIRIFRRQNEPSMTFSSRGYQNSDRQKTWCVCHTTFTYNLYFFEIILQISLLSIAPPEIKNSRSKIVLPVDQFDLILFPLTSNWCPNKIQNFILYDLPLLRYRRFIRFGNTPNRLLPSISFDLRALKNISYSYRFFAVCLKLRPSLISSRYNSYPLHSYTYSLLVPRISKKIVLFFLRHTWLTPLLISIGITFTVKSSGYGSKGPWFEYIWRHFFSEYKILLKYKKKYLIYFFFQ